MHLVRKFASKVNYSFIYCLPLGFAFAAAPVYLEEGRFIFTAGFIPLAFLHCAGFMLLDFIMRFLIMKAAEKSNTIETPGIFDRFMNLPVSVLFIGLLIFICWLPSLIALYPGTVINDTWGQLIQFLRFQSGANALYDHHPVVSTLIMGWTIVSLQEIFYDWQIAFFIYVLIQAFLTGLAFAVSVWYAYRHLKTGKCTAIFMFLAYSILPIYPASVQTISKDALSTWAFVIFAVLIMEGVRTEGNVFSSWKYLLSVTILALFCSLTRKVNPYVVLLSLLVLLVFIRHKRFFLLIPIMAVSIIMFGLLPHLFSRYGVEPGGKQEMFSIPFQQTARYVEDYPDDITHEEYLAIDHLLYMEDLVDRYNPISADGVKGFWELGETDDYVRYLKAWFAEGLRHPFAYVDAFNAMLAGWFSFEEYDPMMNMDSHSQLNTDYLPDYITMRDEPFDESAAFYQNMFDVIYGIPVLNLLFTYGFYAILIPAFSLWTTIIHHRQRKKHDWLALVPMLSSLILGCFLAPLSVYSEGRRYLYPLTYTMPLMIAWCVFICKSAVASHLQKG